MKIDKIQEFTFNRGVGGFVSQNYSQSALTHVMITSTMGRTTGEDLVSIKLRTSKSTYILVDNMTVRQLSFLSNYRYGFGDDTLAGSRTLAIDELFGASAEDALIDAKAAWNVRKRRNNKPLSFLVPLGHITLGGDYELEVSVRAIAVSGATKIETIKIYAVHTKTAPDYLLTHDTTGDNDATMSSCREVFAVANGGFFVKDDGGYPDIRFEVKTPFFNSSASVEDYLALTALFGAFETDFFTVGCKLVGFEDALPEDNVRVKTMGSDMNSATIVYVKETLLSATSDSTLKQLQELSVKVKELERKEPSRALEYRHAGVIPKAEEIDESIEVIEAGKKAENV